MPGRLFLPRWRENGGEYKTSKVWWWEVPNGHGGKFRGSTRVKGGKPGKPPVEAQRVLIQKLAEFGRGDLLGPLSWPTMAQMVVAHHKAMGGKSLDRYKECLLHLDSFFLDTKAHEITPSKIEAYAAFRKEQGSAVATINMDLALLGLAFKLAMRDGLISKKPIFSKLPGAKVRTGFVSDDELAAILRGMPEPQRDVATFLRLTGWRLSEPLKLTWQHVDWQQGSVRIEAEETKRSYARTFPFYPPLRTLMEHRLSVHHAFIRAGRVVPWIFCDADGMRMFRWHVYNCWLAARKLLGSSKTLHDLRRTFAREARQAGVDPTTVCELAGWRTMSMFKRYAISDLTSLRQGVEKMAAPDLGGGQIALFSEAKRK